MTNDNRVVSLRKEAGERSFTLPTALIRLRDYSGQALRKELSEFFDSADDALFNMADKAGTNQDQTAYFDAMRELRLRRKSMTLSMLQWVARAFNEIGAFDPQPRANGLTEVDQDSLSLLDHGDLEQQVAIDNLTNKLRNRHLESIRMLVSRFQHLAPKFDLQDRQMPLSPEVICSGLQEACNDLDIDIRAKLVVLKLFDKLFIARLDNLYRDANTLLVKSGVLPDMKRPPVSGSGTKQHVATSRGQVPPSTPQAFGRTSGHGESTSLREEGADATFSELSALLHNSSDGDAPVGTVGRAGAQGGGVLDTGELMQQLALLQRRAESAEVSFDGSATAVISSNLTHQVESALAGRGQSLGALNQVDADVVNLVTMLFDFILEDRQLPPLMKATIGRLQIPILKVALLDRSFFNRGGHPARKLLNELAMAGIGWNAKAEGQRDPLRDKIQSVVDRLLSEFTDNVAIFSELLDEFSHFMDLDRRRRELVEQRLRDAEEGRARQERARTAATEVLAAVTHDRQLPPVVETLLGEPWSKVLQFFYLREGEDSENWKQSAELAAQLVWSVDPQPVTEDTRGELLRQIPSIVDNLRKGLHSIAWDPFASDAMIRDLELAHVDALQQMALGTPTTEAKVEVAAPATTRTMPHDELLREPTHEELAAAELQQAQSAQMAEAVTEPATREKAPRQAHVAKEPAPAAVPSQAEVAIGAEKGVAETGVLGVEQRWVEMAEKLRVGSWVELVTGGQKIRCKLAAIIKATGKYIFVNRNGAKVSEYTLQDVAKALSTGEVSLLDDGLIFDRALESIIDNLRHSRRD
ncbi:DUF1631 domain-containing protein [Marinobacter fonticola]|uniref:DUF1631 domain-containing protein n=1 Tax=Marinobacter fonticola TaxID=2603215 RepID=UPI0011E72ABC|nr:DUF1631 domain-containing protein [Marinobacter fonticola]